MTKKSADASVKPDSAPPETTQQQQLPEHAPIGANAYIEERPKLSREARSILARVHRTERKTRQEWDKLAIEYGGNR